MAKKSYTIDAEQVRPGFPVGPTLVLAAGIAVLAYFGLREIGIEPVSYVQGFWQGLKF